MGRTDLLAIDGSEQANYAFNWYLDNMHREGDSVLLVHCAELNIDIGLPGAAADVDAICAQVKARQDEIGTLTEHFTNQLRAKKIDNKCLTPSGDKPGALICKAAKDNGVQSIIMGTRGMGAIKRTFIGSVSEYVIHHATCPVTIVRNPAEK